MNTEASLESAAGWQPPDDWSTFVTIDAHTEGEPLRIILGGYPRLDGPTILSRRRQAARRHDALRKALMWEPRGHADMYGCLIMPPTTPEADFGVLFLHNEGYSTMCGHAIIAVTKVALETGMLPRTPPVTRVRIDTPAGMVTAFANINGTAVTSVRFRNVPSFVYAADQQVEVEGLGSIRYDVAFGGAFYAFVQAEEAGLRCTPEYFTRLVERGMAIKRAIMAQQPIAHPFEEDLGFLYGTIFIDEARDPGGHSRNVCVFAEGEVDRSPTGTGVSGRAALHYARGEAALGEPLLIESIIGSRFTVRVAEETTFGPHPAIIPEVEGRAYITGRNQFCLDPADPLRHGFILR